MDNILKPLLQKLEQIENKIDERIYLPPVDSWPGTWHIFDTKGIRAIKACLAAERPLLVRGEPGTGKSQLARAAAHVLGRAFLYEVVHARSECGDLQYTYDAVSRLGEAQALGAARETITIKEQLDPLRYVRPGVLWWAFDWDSASIQNERCFHRGKKPSTPGDWKQEHGCVVLIDEIDKADADLPNGLLETLGNGRFTVPFVTDREAIGLSQAIPPPLVVITTNEERELPAAFIRRCLVLYLELPEKGELIDWLLNRGKVHFHDLSEDVMQKAAEQLSRDRYEAIKSGIPAPGQAEYLDMLRAVSRIKTKKEDQLRLLDEISEFALKKNPKDTYS